MHLDNPKCPDHGPMDKEADWPDSKVYRCKTCRRMEVVSNSEQPSNSLPKAKHAGFTVTARPTSKSEGFDK